MEMVPGGGVEPPRGCPRRILSPFFPHRTSLHRGAPRSRSPLFCYGWGQLRYACRRKALHGIPEQSITTCIPKKLTIATLMVKVDRQTSLLEDTASALASLTMRTKFSYDQENR